uniref:Sm domain-containing protein n=1 Tax=Strigamia maritima TaxID=126957 RepID=T1IY48_STRMM
MSLKERAITCNTLVCLVKSLEKKATTIELKNESSVTGNIESVDAYMNVQMNDVVFLAPNGSLKKFQTFFIQGRQVRYVHIPDDVDIGVAIQSNLTSIKNVSSYKQPDWKLKKSTFPINVAERTATESTNLSGNLS